MPKAERGKEKTPAPRPKTHCARAATRRPSAHETNGARAMPNDFLNARPVISDAVQSANPERADMNWRGGVFSGAMWLVVVAAWSLVIFQPAVGRALGFGREGAFFDLRGSLAAGEASVAGRDPYAINPLDPYGRPHFYSSWWLVTGKIGLTQADLPWIGPVLLGIFLAAVAWAWRPRGLREIGVGLAVLLSPAWLLAVYRANNDLVVFIGIAVVIFCLQRTTPAARLGGAALVGALAVLKYFPAGALIGILHARHRRELLLLLAGAAAVVLLGWASVEPALAAVAQYAPRPTGLTTFGAPVLGTTLPDLPGVLVGLLAAGAGGLGFYWGPRLCRASTAQHDERGELPAVVAAAVILLSFAIGSSYNYKLIFLWWLIPWLLRVSAAIDPGHRRRLLILLVVACWADGLVMGFSNLFAPGWSRDQRALALTFMQGTTIVTQLGYWVIAGACARVLQGWTVRELKRLARDGGETPPTTQPAS
ncbi:MAG: hypothetical protein JNK23_09775 [Opitutaceae bacterium]|nr:hypothetical protein [Opitutaceae bacterium]